MNAGVASSSASDGSIPKSTPHRVQTLSRTGSRDVSESQGRRDALFAAAASLRAACTPHELSDLIADRQLAVLAHALADEHLQTNPASDVPVPAFEVALNRFLAALDSAIPAVRTCRQTAHSAHACWFLTAETDCADVLKSAHNHAS